MVSKQQLWTKKPPKLFEKSMNIPVWPTYLLKNCPNFFPEKIWHQQTLPTYDLTYVRNFAVFFLEGLPKFFIIIWFFSNVETKPSLDAFNSIDWQIRCSADWCRTEEDVFSILCLQRWLQKRGMQGKNFRPLRRLIV